MCRYIAIEGNIGAGKSTLSKMLAKELNARIILEQFEDNSFLPKFYKEPARYAFPLETSFLASRFNQLKNVLNNQDLFAGRTLADYSLFKSLVFAKINLDEDEYHLFMRIFEIIEKQIPAPELIVYLHRPVSRLLQNITKRGRTYELEIQASYLESIHNGYLEYFKSLTNQRILIIRADNLDYEHQPEDYEYLRRLILDDYEPGIKMIP